MGRIPPSDDSTDLFKAEAENLYRSMQRLGQAYNDDLPLDLLSEQAISTHIDFETLSEQERMVWIVLSLTVMQKAMARFDDFQKAMARDRARR
jgi:hypothetical protein